MSTASLSRLTSSKATVGVARPAMSLMQIESAPQLIGSAISLARSTKVSMVWIGLVV